MLDAERMDHGEHEVAHRRVLRYDEVAVARHSAAGNDDGSIHVVVLVRLAEARAFENERVVEQ